MLAYHAVKQNRGRELQFIKHAEYAPNPHPKAVFPPSIVAMGLRAATLRRISASACQEGEIFDIESDVKGEAMAVGPIEVSPFLNR
jgi:hypothetical protein